MEDKAQLYQFATARQREYLDAWEEYGTIQDAATALGINVRTMTRSLATLRKKAALQGYSPDHSMTKTVPDGFSVKGVSTLYNSDGEVSAQWVKSTADRTEATIAALDNSIQRLLDNVGGAFKSKRAPKTNNKDIMCVYPIADAHMGMYAWKEETGANFDAQKCSDTIINGVGTLIDAAPPSETCLIANLADYFHTDTQENRTLRSGHVLDVDSRWSKIFDIGFDAYIKTIEMALEKHKKVIVKSARGNHDEHSSYMLAKTAWAYFKDEPRVEVHLPYSEFSYHHFGQSLIGINHGMVKPNKLPGIMATDKRELWGATRFHFWYTGHIHHKTVEEFAGCVTETFRSPAAKDKYTYAAGYRAERDLVMIKHHKERGEVGRTVETIF